MALIDQRILIDAPTDVVWRLLADSSRLPSWNAAYRSVSVLTTLPTGVGMRRRCTLASGKDVIEQITAWVDGLGYEYVIVDGGPYRTFQARFRLQGGPDGTSVQWTVFYRRKGLFGGLRDALGGSRATASMMATSLRQLRREVDQMGMRMAQEERAKFAIRERLNADQRAQYQRRYQPPPGAEEAEAVPEAPPAPAIITPPPPPPSEPSFVANLGEVVAKTEPKPDTEPKAPSGLKEAIAEGAVHGTNVPPPDTLEPPAVIPPEHRPFARPPAGVTPPPAPVEELAPDEELPTHLRRTPARGIPSITPSTPAPVVPSPAPPPDSATDAAEPPHLRITPARGIPSTTPSTPAPAVPSPAPPPAAPTPPPDSVRKTPARGIPSQRPAAPPPGSARRTPARGIPSIERIERAASSAAQTPRPPHLPPPTPKTDTGEISIWEIFGLARPSEQDQEVLDSLVQSVQARKIGEQWVREGSRRWPSQVRRTQWGVIGLRLRRALEASHVRWRRAGMERPGE